MAGDVTGAASEIQNFVVVVPAEAFHVLVENDDSVALLHSTGAGVRNGVLHDSDGFGLLSRRGPIRLKLSLRQ